MAESQANTDDGRVSREAHQRVTTERDTLKAQLDASVAALSDLTKATKASDFFAEKGLPAKEAKWAAEMALPHLREVEVGDLDTALASDRFQPMWNNRTPASGTPDPTPAQPPPSGFATGPSPAADGAPIPPERFTARSPEVQALVAAGDEDTLNRWDREGKIAWNPNNPYVEPPKGATG